jgi:DNA-binding NarL/FixJ family response regulator
VLSNYTDRSIVHDALSLGIVEYVEKASITPSLLPGQVRRWLER